MSLFTYRNSFERTQHIASMPVVTRAAKDAPLVSIMIPTFRRYDLIQEAIASALNQTAEFPFEVVVVDNDPAPQSPDVLKALVEGFYAANLKLYRNQENLGMVGNWNRCISLASAAWFITLHDDDVMHPDMLLQLWRNRQGVRLVAPSFLIFGSGAPPQNMKGRAKSIQEGLSWRFRSDGIRRDITLSDVVKSVPIPASGTLFNRGICLKLGGYDPALWPHFDYAFSAKYILLHGGVLLREKLLNYRMQENESRNPQTYIRFPQADYLVRRAVTEGAVRAVLRKRVIVRLLKKIRWFELQIVLSSIGKGDENLPYAVQRLKDKFYNESFANSIRRRLVHRVCYGALWLLFRFVLVNDLAGGRKAWTSM